VVFRPHRVAKDDVEDRDGTVRIRLAIVSRQRLIRDALAVLVSGDDGIAVVNGPGNGSGPDADEPSADVTLVDMPATANDGIELLAAIQRKSPQSKLLLLMDTSDEALVMKALKAGAKGCISRGACASDLGKAIRRVHEGDVWAARRMLVRCLGEQPPASVNGRSPGARLTAREREIVQLLASGGTNKEIARALLISEKTVKAHLGSVFRKLQVTGRLQAVVYAIRQGLP
jgi:DNA-binding NarL/FixJ family response regulator